MTGRVDMNSLLRAAAGRAHAPEQPIAVERPAGQVRHPLESFRATVPQRRRGDHAEVNQRLRAAVRLARDLTVAPGVNVDLHDPYGRR
jgi:hypothetical protein